MSQYVIHLVFAILFLLAACVCLFVLFRHIEIRKVEQQNVDAEEIAGIKRKRKHSGKDDMIVLLRVLLIVIFLVILMDEDKGTRWVMLVISYLLVSFLSLLFLAKSGTIAPTVRERKWEYLALFSVLVFAAGAAISLLNYAVLKMKYGKSYFGAARIVGYNEEDDAEEVAYYEKNYEDGGEEKNEQGEENHEDGDNEDHREGEDEGKGEGEGEGEDKHEEEGEGEGEDKHEGEGEGRRKLEDGKGDEVRCSYG
jgi:Ca2+/Na+ antiporter